MGCSSCSTHPCPQSEQSQWLGALRWSLSALQASPQIPTPVWLVAQTTSSVILHLTSRLLQPRGPRWLHTASTAGGLPQKAQKSLPGPGCPSSWPPINFSSSSECSAPQVDPSGPRDRDAPSAKLCPGPSPQGLSSQPLSSSHKLFSPRSWLLVRAGTPSR